MAMESDKTAAQAGEVPENESVMTTTKYLKYEIIQWWSLIGNKDIGVKCILHTI